MATLSEKAYELAADVQLLERENARLTSALAKLDAEVFTLKKSQRISDAAAADQQKQFDTKLFEAGKPKSTYDVRSFNRKPSSLEDDVRKYLGLSPHEADSQKNDKRFLTSLDKTYGAAQVDAMIATLRQV